MYKLPTSNWLILNYIRIDELLKKCEINDFKGSFGGELDLKEIMRIIRGAVEEIKVLSKKVEELEKNN